MSAPRRRGASGRDAGVRPVNQLRTCSIVRSIPPEQEILFAPDRHLGAFLSKTLNRPMTLWPGTCIVHEQFSEREILKLKAKHPELYEQLVAYYKQDPLERL